MAAGIIHRPRIVLMDEPTVGVDPQSRNRIFEMIEALRAEGTSIIYTTHYMEEAQRLCDRVAIIDHGRIIASGTSEELIANAFASRSQVLARFEGPESGSAHGSERHGGGWWNRPRSSPSKIRRRLRDCSRMRRRPGWRWWMFRCGGRIWSRSFCTSPEGSYAIDLQYCAYRIDCAEARPRLAGVELYPADRLLQHLRDDLRRRSTTPRRRSK